MDKQLMYNDDTITENVVAIVCAIFYYLRISFVADMYLYQM